MEVDVGEEKAKGVCCGIATPRVCNRLRVSEWNLTGLVRRHKEDLTRFLDTKLVFIPRSFITKLGKSLTFEGAELPCLVACMLVLFRQHCHHPHVILENRATADRTSASILSWRDLSRQHSGSVC